MINILGKRYWFFAASLIIIISGLILLFTHGDPRSIDFKGGTSFRNEIYIWCSALH